MNLLRLNPEFQRCLWLELTPTRLLIMPALIALIFGGMHLVGVEDLAKYVFTALGVLLVLWGTRLAADSFAEEVAERTWDVQRLSASSPTSIALGKLLGGTVYAWYGAGFCVAILLTQGNGWSAILLVTSLLGGLVCQSAALFAALALHRIGGGVRRGRVTLAQLIGIGAGSWGNMAIIAGLSQAAGKQSLVWYGATYDIASFALVFQAIMAIWYFVGSVRLIRRELGFRDGPVMWTAFTVFAAVVAGGFTSDGPLSPAFLSAAVAMAGMLSYVALLASPLAAVDIKRLALGWQSGQWLRVWRQVPVWLPSAVLAIALDLTLIASAPGWISALGHWWVIGAPFRAGWLALFLRDIALVCWIRLRFPQRTTLVLIVLGVLLYGFLPWVFLVGGGGWKRLLVPDMSNGPFDLIGPWVQAAVMATILGLRVRSILKS